MRRFMRRLLAPIAIVALAVVTYANAIDGAFHFDDQHAVVDNPSIRSLSDFGRFFTDGRMFTVLPQDQEYRPIVLVTYALTARFFGVAPRPFIAVNLAIHSLCALMMFWTLRRVRPVLGMSSGDGNAMPWLAAAIFAVHPLFSECVNYVHARSESLSTLFSLVALYAYFRAREAEGRPSADPWLVTGAVALFVALMSKVIAGMVPFLALTIEWAAAERHRRAAVAQRLAVLTFPVLVFSLIYVRLSSPFAVASRSGFTRSQYLYSQLPAIFHYVRLFFWPSGQSADADYPVAQSAFEVRVMLSGAMMTAVVLFTIVNLARRRHSELATAIAWFLLCLAPTSSLFPLGEIVNEHRPYMAAMALCAITAEWLLVRLPVVLELDGRVGRTVVGVAAAASLTLASALGIARNRVWRSEEALWRDVVRNAPRSPRAQGNFGHALMVAGGTLEAEPHLRESLRLAPSYPYALLMLGTWIFRVGDLAAAVPHFDRAMTIDPNLFYAYYLRGLVGEALGEPRAQLVALFERTTQLSPTYADGWYHLSLARDATGDLAGTVAAAERSVALRADYDDRFMLAYALLRANRVAEALPLLSALQGERPGDTRVLQNLDLARRLAKP
jgi:hypothetical protein